MKIQIVGRLWNDSTKEIVEIDGAFYVLDGWNGDYYNHCWEVLDPKGLERVGSSVEYVIEPVYTQVNNDDFIITNFILRGVN